MTPEIKNKVKQEAERWLPDSKYRVSNQLPWDSTYNECIQREAFTAGAKRGYEMGAEEMESIGKQALEALREVIRISDRKHDAWDKAKSILKKADEFLK